MRERLYITTCEPIWSERTCLNYSNKYKNVMMYSPDRKAIFLNGQRYGSINGIDPNLDRSILFTLTHDKYNVLHLNQRNINIEANLVFSFLDGELHDNDTIKCHVGERIQILSNTPVNIYNNKQYYWKSTSNNIATIDRNNIITPLKESSLRCKICLVNVDDETDILFSLQLLIYKSTKPFKNIALIDPDDIDSQIYGFIDNYHDIMWDKVDEAVIRDYPYTINTNNDNDNNDTNNNYIDPFYNGDFYNDSNFNWDRDDDFLPFIGHQL